jgi:hypothetical protein
VRTAAALAVALGAVVVTTASAAPRPHLERASLGAVDVSFTYVYDAAQFRFSKQRLVIVRDGETRFAAALPRPPAPGFNAQPANYFGHRLSVSVRHLDGDGEPEVVLDLYWGGAHCCWYTQVYGFNPAASIYRPLVHVWGNVGYALKDLSSDGVPELVARDDRFSYAFGSFADSRWPLRVLSYRGGRLVFVTKDYPRELGRDAAKLWREATSRKSENHGALAAWAAEQCLLGRSNTAFATLGRLRRQGRLHGGEPAAKYLAHLHRFLRRTGYL